MENREFLLGRIWENVREKCPPESIRQQCPPELFNEKLEKFKEMMFSGKEYDPRFLLDRSIRQIDQKHATWFNNHDFKLIAV
jgi:hypothetical protein